MVFQFFCGAVILLVTLVVASAGFWGVEMITDRLMPWIRRPPHALKMTFLLLQTAIIVLGITILTIWIWAFGFLWLEVFDHLETAVYFTTVTFTTLGFGDISVPVEWRILGGITALNGLLNIGLFAAMIVEVLRRARTEQRNL